MNKSIDDLRNALETIRKEHYPGIDPTLVKLIIDIESTSGEDETIKAKKVIKLIEDFSNSMEGNNA